MFSVYGMLSQENGFEKWKKVFIFEQHKPLAKKLFMLTCSTFENTCYVFYNHSYNCIFILVLLGQFWEERVHWSGFGIKGFRICEFITVKHWFSSMFFRYQIAHIWACPPSEGDDYIFHCHPIEQKIPKHKRLVDWYKKMLDKAVRDRVVIEYKVK